MMEKVSYKEGKVKKRKQYIRNACNQCKIHKVRCTGGFRCQRCMKRDTRCIYDERSAEPKSTSKLDSIKRQIRQLRSSLNNTLKSVEQLDDSLYTDVEVSDRKFRELDILLLETARDIETCRYYTKGKETPRSSPPASPRPANLDCVETNKLSLNHGILSMTKFQSLELLKYFRTEGIRFYPFIPFDLMEVLVETIFNSRQAHRVQNSNTLEWDDVTDPRNTDFLGLLLACATASKVKVQTSPSHELATMAAEKLMARLNGSGLDVKDVAITALLSIYHLQCDDIVRAWRNITIAAKVCQELGLNKSVTEHPAWVTNLFWTIYVLDRRFSFMLGFPYALYDTDIDHTHPEHDFTLYRISALVKYTRIAAKIVPRLPKIGSEVVAVPASTCQSLDAAADQWAISTSINLPSASRTYQDIAGVSLSADFEEAWIIVSRNHLKLATSKHHLFSTNSIRQDQNLSAKAVQCAKDTIKFCFQLQSTTPFYDQQAVHLNYFVLSSMAALYLAVRHAPLQFSTSSQDFFTGLKILQSTCSPIKGSRKLWEKSSALEKAMLKLGCDPFGMGPQLLVNNTVASCGLISDGDAGMEYDVSETDDDLFVPFGRRESFEDFLTQVLADETFYLHDRTSNSPSSGYSND